MDYRLEVTILRNEGQHVPQSRKSRVDARAMINAQERARRADNALRRIRSKNAKREAAESQQRENAAERQRREKGLPVNAVAVNTTGPCASVTSAATSGQPSGTGPGVTPGGDVRPR